MTNWNYTFNISQVWNNDELSVEDKGKAISTMIGRIFPSDWFDPDSNDYDWEIDEIAQCFEDITGYDDITPVEEFNNVMSAFYDWADLPTGVGSKMCWIVTRERRKT